MRAPRFLVPDLPSSGRVSLPEPESHHAIKVLRMKLGAEIELFDGAGNVGQGKIVEIGKRDVEIEIEHCTFAPNDHHGKLTLAVALPKGDRQRGTIEKLTELGADRLIPLDTAFGVAEVNDRNQGRLERYAIEACKQSRRNRLVSISETLNIKSFCETIRTLSQAGVRSWVLHPPNTDQEYQSMEQLSSQFLQQSLPGVVFAIGPEGGFSESEVEAMVQSGAMMLSLGERILRVETAVAVACTLGSLWVGTAENDAITEGQSGEKLT
ncbi:RsmE family RNA methyltransferase [Pirellulaceae bacterium SH449]